MTEPQTTSIPNEGRTRPPLRVLLTGVTGFVGAAVLRLWLAGGLDRMAGLRCLVRDRDRALALGIPEATLVIGDLESSEILESAVAGVDCVVHVAGATRALSPTEFEATNVAGTARLVEAFARRAAAEARFVLVSSLAAAGPSTDGRGTDAEPGLCRPCSAYGRSKLDGERRVIERLGVSGRWLMIRPPVVYGPGDAGTRLLFRSALSPLAAVVPWRRRPLSIVHVEDAARAIVAAIEHVDVNGAFIPLDGPARVDPGSLFRAIGSACGRRVRVVRVPMAAVQAVAPLGDLWNRWRGVPGFFGIDKVREIGAVGWVADGGPAERLLGIVPEVELDEGLREVALAERFVESQGIR